MRINALVYFLLAWYNIIDFLIKGDYYVKEIKCNR